ncbi:MAG: 16S rRNA (uracil(1498)-N(3))-methyltransferase [Oscillospiraceae bacterium]|nr:16S rRNA (uracil(1498)-N(3))-methyltransferase [Oscillospiraceae bacterium]
MSDKQSTEKWRYPRFFSDDISGENITLNEADARHAERVLRLENGSPAIICDGDEVDYLCAFIGNGVFKIVESFPNTAEPTVYLRLFQCLPKSDKMDFIVQKAAELGVAEIIPVISARCVSRPDEIARNKKVKRWRKIVREAAKQCGRGKIPNVGDLVGFETAVSAFNRHGAGIIFYECGGERLNRIVEDVKHGGAVDIFIGSEGGFEVGEIELARTRGIVPVTLGKRILRVETAPIAAISILMNLTDNI